MMEAHHCLATKGDLPVRIRSRPSIKALYEDQRNILMLTPDEHRNWMGTGGHIPKSVAHGMYIERFGRDRAEQYLAELNQHLTIKLRLRA